MRTRIVAAPAAIILAALTIPTIAMAWPAPQPGHPACIPVGDGTYTIVQDAQPPFPKGSHQPEHGTCEGPVVQPPAPAPQPAPAPAPVVIVQQVPVPTPVPDTRTVCTSRRVYHFLTRTKINGRRVVGVKRVLVRGQEKYGSFKRVRRHGHTRFQISADYRGLVVPKGQLRTVVTFLQLAGSHDTMVPARTVRTVQFLRLCLPNDGNPNDASTQGRAAR